MYSDQLRHHVLELARPVCQPLRDYIESSSADAEGHLRKFGISTRGWQHTNLTRAHLDCRLTSEPIPGLRLLEPRQNGRLMLASPDGSTLRVLHVGPQGTIPAPGRNGARVRYFQQQHLDLPLPGMGLASALLLIWAVDGDGAATLRLARPIGRWRHGTRAKVDLDMILPRDAADLDDLEFTPDDRHLELHIPSEELVDQHVEIDDGQ